MKILCPTDFSTNSLNAAFWIADYLSSWDSTGTIHFLHCANVRRRAEMFIKMDHYLKENALQDLMAMITKLKNEYPDLHFESKVQLSDPKSFIPKYATDNDFDFIVMGSKGLTALKNLTVGSVTNTIIKKSNLPVLVIPEDSKYQPIERVVIGVDNDLTHLAKDIEPVYQILPSPDDIDLHLVHVAQKGDLMDQYNLKPTADLKGFKTVYKTIEFDDSIAESLMEYCDDEHAQLLIMIHEQRNWLQRIFHKNLSKEGLFELEIPFLILQEQDHPY